MSKVKFSRVRVTAPLGVSVQASAHVQLSPRQAEARMPWLAEVKGVGFKVTSAIQLKRGEEFGVDDLRRLARDGVELIDAAPKIVKGGKSTPDEAAEAERAKAEAEAAEAERVKAEAEAAEAERVKAEAEAAEAAEAAGSGVPVPPAS